jgi:hypothetical protein
MVEQSIALENGWNWISVNVTNSSNSILSQFINRIGGKGLQIQSKNAYIEAPDWIGTLTDIEKEQMYLVQTNAAGTLKFDGTPAVAAASPITLTNGWNWIGYIPQFTLPVNDALAALTPAANDQINGIDTYRTYNSNANLWLGNLNYLRSGEGYMYYSGNAVPQQFNYPGESSQIYHAPAMRAASSEAATANHWEVNIHAYPSAMTMTSVVIKNGGELHSDQIEIAAFAPDGECRGSQILNNYPTATEHPYLAFLMVYGEETVPLTFKVFDHSTNTEYNVMNTENFIINDRYGNSRAPYEFILGVFTGNKEISIEQITVYPNPVKDWLQINHDLESIDVLQVVDISGRLILEKTDFVEKSLNVSALANGVYLLRLTKDGETVIIKITKK